MDAKTRKRTLRLISHGVYVLTSRSAGRYGAATVTWVSQASFKPPLVMAAIRRDSNVFKCLAESGTAVLQRVVEAECRDRVHPLTVAETPWSYGG